MLKTDDRVHGEVGGPLLHRSRRRVEADQDPGGQSVHFDHREKVCCDVMGKVLSTKEI